MRASASKSALLTKCQYWAREDVALPLEKKNAAAARGTKVHEVIATALTTNAFPSFDEDDWVFSRSFAGVRQAKLMRGPEDKLLTECTFALHPAQGTVAMGSLKGRGDYPNDMFCGTADLVHVAQGNKVKIRDWKTGKPSPETEAWQLRSLAAMAHECGYDVVDAKAIYLTDGEPQFGENALAGATREDDAATLRKHLAMVPSAEPAPGYWCREYYCPLRNECKGLGKAA